MTREPVRTAGGLAGATTALVAAVVGTLDLDPDLAIAIVGLVGVLMPLLLGEVARRRTTPFDLVGSVEVALHLLGPSAAETIAAHLRVPVARVRAVLDGLDGVERVPGPETSVWRLVRPPKEAP